MEPNLYPYDPNESRPRPAAVVVHSPVPDDEPAPFSLWAILTDLWEWRFLIVGTTILAGVAAFVFGTLAPKRYDALATVFVTPPTFVSELKPAPFSIEAYDRLAKSDYVTARTMEAARKQGIIGPQGPGVSFSTVLYDSRESGKPYLPIIGLQASAANPQIAQQAANLWARVFIEEQQKFSSVGKAASIDFILTEYPKASKDLTATQRDLKAVQQDQAKDLGTMKTRLAPEFITQQLEARQEAQIASEEDLRTTQLSLQESEKRLAELKKALEQTPERLTLAKAMSDDAMWARGTAREALPASKLVTEQVNPVHTSLSGDLAAEQVTAASLRARVQGLQQNIKTLRGDIAALRGQLIQAQLSIENLTRDQKLQAATYERAVEDAKSRVTRLESKVGEAQLAKAERDTDIKLGATAELPTSPSGPNIYRNVVLAMVFAAAIAVCAAWVLTQLKLHGRRGVRPASAI